jgi:low temperature requirement protein LtrA
LPVNGRKHLRLFIMATIVWAVFWVIGLPSYFQQYSSTFMLWFDGILLVGVIEFLFRVFRPVPSSRRMTLAWWIAFYFTVPLAAYDWLYCGVYLGHGWAFVWRYWYLTVYYVLPWFVVPGVAALVNRRSDARLEKGAA